MKLYDFNDIVPRKGTYCVKHDMTPEVFGTDDLLPMWVADMDFKTPDFILEAIRKRCEHEVLGYTFAPDGYKMAVLNWFQKRYGIATKWNRMRFVPGIVQGIAFALQTFTQPGDKVLITTPVYPPFINVPHRTGRVFVSSPLKTVNGRFSFDFDDFERKAEGCKILILSNPHNPGGTVWTKEELARVADICLRKGVLVISDEIHADLTYPGFKHTSFTTVSEAAERGGGGLRARRGMAAATAGIPAGQCRCCGTVPEGALPRNHLHASRSLLPALDGLPRLEPPAERVGPQAGL